MIPNFSERKVQIKHCVIAVGLVLVLIKTNKILKNIKTFFYTCFHKKLDTYVVSSHEEINTALDKLQRRLQGHRVLGLDCEWVSHESARRPVALLQLAAPGGPSCLFRLCHLKTVPSRLAELLDDEKVLKVGVAVVTDARYLWSDYGVRCQGCLDLRHVASQVGVEPRGLAYLAKELLGVELDKDWQVRCSNWEAEQLTLTQVQYAAEDAFVAVQIFHKLNHAKICQNYSVWSRMLWNKKDYWQKSYNLWLDYVGLNFGHRYRADDRNERVPMSRMSKPADSATRRSYSTIAQKQHYSNNFLLAPDGKVLSTISDSKAAWYIEKDLVVVVKEEPKTLKLKFEPAGRSDPDGYYTKPKANRCVVCGTESNLLRKNVVPNEYRKYFEEAIKNHNSHDVLLLCLPCHMRSNLHDQTLREQLVVECEPPLGNSSNSRLVEIPDLKAVKSAAKALFNNGDRIPAQRKDYLMEVICSKLSVTADHLTPDLLLELSNINCRVESESYSPHGQKVVQHFSSRGGVEMLERRWRQHFLDTMRPQFLPQLWSVDYIHETSFTATTQLFT